MAAELCLENALFIEDHRRLSDIVIHTTPENYEASTLIVKRGVTAIFDRFIKNDAPLQLNIPDPILRKLNSNVKDGNLKLEVLDEVRKEVDNMIYRNTFKRFIMSGSYKSETKVNVHSCLSRK